MTEVFSDALMGAHMRRDDDFAEWYVEDFMKSFLPQ